MVSQLGDRVGELALPLVAVTVLHAGAAQVGVLTAALWLPYLGSLFVGSWIDHRQRKRRILVYADIGRIVVLGSVPATFAAGVLTLQYLYAVAILLGIGEVFFNTAVPNVFVNLVDTEQYVAGSSALSASRSGSYLAGPALGGWLVQLISAPFALLADALSFAGSALLVGCIPMRESAPMVQPDTVVQRARVGLRFVLRNRYLRTMLGCSTTINFFNFVGSTLLVLFARRTLGLSAAVIGLSFGIGAAGSLLGALGAPRLGRQWGTGRVGLLGAAVFSAAAAVPALAGGPLLSRAMVLTVAVVTSGIGVMLYDVSFNAIKTAVIPHDMRSRATGAYSTINYGIRPLGAIVGGVLGSTIGIRPTFVLAATGAALSILWLIGSPLLRVRAIADLDGADPRVGLSMPAGDSSPMPIPVGMSHVRLSTYQHCPAIPKNGLAKTGAEMSNNERDRSFRLAHLEPDDWHADLDGLAAGLVEHHRDPFHAVSRAQLDAAVARLHDRIPDLSGTGILVGFDAVAAMIGDGHTSVETDRHYRRFPLELFWYGEQLRVVKSVVYEPRLVGAELVAIAGVDVKGIDRELQTLIPQCENPWYERDHSAALLTRADVLAALGYLPDVDIGELTFITQEGATVTTNIASLPPGIAPTWPPAPADAPLRLRSPEAPLAYTHLAGTGTTYANFRRYAGLEAAAPPLIAHLRETNAACLVLDLRDNSGGDYTLARHNLIYPIWSLRAINRPGGLYVLVGRRTFSAAMVTATDFRRETEAVLVGEPTGARPVGYQESGTFTLPRSGLRVHCAIRHYRFSDTDNIAVFPDQRVDPEWDSEASGHDAAIDWCLRQPA